MIESVTILIGLCLFQCQVKKNEQTELSCQIPLVRILLNSGNGRLGPETPTVPNESGINHAKHQGPKSMEGNSGLLFRLPLFGRAA